MTGPCDDDRRLDYRDLVIGDLADAEVRLCERVASLESDVEIYRLLALEAITTIRNVTTERDRCREQLQRLQEEYRHLREHILRGQTEAA